MRLLSGCREKMVAGGYRRSQHQKDQCLRVVNRHKSVWGRNGCCDLNMQKHMSARKGQRALARISEHKREDKRSSNQQVTM
mmetsp:Transcript_11811/g.30152  ORF Transcript_11811/g.30152 Transcript_11811/m.30152 type:complete len:81 (+) Transcript_11811:310-552(+)